MKTDDTPITRQKFMEELHRYRKGSVTRRHFLGVTGLGTAMAVLGGTLPMLRPGPALAGDIGDRVILATWPNYHDAANFDLFRDQTGAAVQVNVFGSNEEMLAKLQAGGSGWDLFVPTNYTITTYVEADLIEPLDLSKLPNYDAAAFEARFAEAGTVGGKLYAVPKNWGTTGMAWDSGKAKAPFTSWKEFFDVTRTDFSGRTIVHDYQLTTIGSALKYFGYSFNSVDPAELAEAEKLLIEVKPHLFAITSDYQPPMRNGDAWLTMCWTGEGKQLNRDLPEIQFALGKEGGEIWSDYYAIPKNAPHRDAAYALLNFLIDPQVNAREALAHGFPVADARVNAQLPAELLNDPILHPAAELLNALEFGAAATLTDPNRAELMARFKSA
ncbi:ABC transporter substrate-binding protein [Rhodobacter capsulatus]|jgi:spermidine/putrescine transport system substrate-binding protein|uniref:Polyamine ABC transporter, periplasmic polyamine-binding protein PotD-3 n=1 Tax=Rhodobacter capsulatus (strain ATCC BAA-309 / NBRC 16581 / SB1003) TaxID=272942 RepID=D5AL08_RHOCB|nr:spermidine/putrescine ABC transporter substrate-binding protein [Rhodobacter capsulatus]ADE85998.1 polyamine ABC transporter, periplasmic polyamine-binding protein PotD-3 [Rhodobacter capsulatus SB 1003]ETD01095.1 potassium transporter Trk [Rhodobacter capsulatus DE442]ETD75680.1 potassium transporter Trk [Rhodobacter capsulatus R121]ETE53312.1 potassium transporter Trk [Rhodobacter capsulatus Y262]MDS0927833.1 spermidine/putrescine ABC transporter substrate-binding protein [Rhodobacter cap